MKTFHTTEGNKTIVWVKVKHGGVSFNKTRAAAHKFIEKLASPAVKEIEYHGVLGAEEIKGQVFYGHEYKIA